VFKLIPTDIGRPFTDIVTDLQYPGIHDDAQEVLSSLVPIERTISTSDNRWFFVSILPYRTIDDRIDGLVITFNDISATKRLEFDLLTSNETLDIKFREGQHLLKEKEIILCEVHHRIKNNMNIISFLLSMQENIQEDTTVKGILKDAAGRMQSMMVLYNKLYHSENKSIVDLRDYIPTLVDEIVKIFPKTAEVSIKTDIENILLSPEILSPLGILINELVTNTMKYAFIGKSSGTISIRALTIGNLISLVFEDDGCGIPDSVRIENSSGFGLSLVSMLAKQLKGTIEFKRHNGTKVVLEFEH
jgi:two-component sensor histidine kinase